MSIRKRFVLFFVCFVIGVIAVTSVISVLFLRDAYTQFAEAKNKAMISIMADKMQLRAIVGFVGLILVVAAVSIPAGILLFRFISRRYLSILASLSVVAQERVSMGERSGMGGEEQDILADFTRMLATDQKKLRDYEKVKAWKDGARLLMHEIKNPLTPLKLSAQSLGLKTGEAGGCSDEVNSILASTSDIEHILEKFKELVNIEFGPKSIIELRALLREFIGQLGAAGKAVEVSERFVSDSVPVLAEPALLKMCLTNLINNGIEADSSGFTITIDERDVDVCMRFITPGAGIEHPARIFRPGYSSKGENRGLGLFLCKLISDYLDLDLTLESAAGDVVFSMKIDKLEGAPGGDERNG